MAHLYLTTIAGPSEDLLGVGLQDFCSGNILNDNSRKSVTVDACDLFQCGKCMKLFTSLTEFVSHKEVHCRGEDVNPATYLSGGTSSDDSNSQYCGVSGQGITCISLTDDISSSLQLASSIFCDNQINKNVVDSGVIESSLKVTAFDTVQVVSNGGLPVNVSVPGSIFLTDITDNTGELFLVKNDDNNNNTNNESETICEPLSVESNISESKNLKCNYCSKVFTKLFNLKQHIRYHTGERPYHCVICGKKFTQISNAKKHITSHKVWPEPWESTCESVNPKGNPSTLTASLYSCRYCPLAFDTFAELKTHRKIHSSHKVFMCLVSECKERFSDIDSLTLHLYSHSHGIFHCSLCQLKFPSFAKLSQHHLSHSFHENSTSEKCVECKEETLSCPLCAKVLSSDNTLRQHLPTHLHRSYPCPSHTCPKYFASLRSAKAHFLSTHSPTSHTLRHQCHKCDASFKRYDNLMRHKKTHKNTLQFKCPFYKAGCTKAFSRKDVWKNHLFTHKRKENTCEICKESLVLTEPSVGSVEVVCRCPTTNLNDAEEENVSSDDNEFSGVAQEDRSFLSCDDTTMTDTSETLNISNNDSFELRGEVLDLINSSGNPSRFSEGFILPKEEKSFVIPHEGIVSCDDENTIEIIVGFA